MTSSGDRSSRERAAQVEVEVLGDQRAAAHRRDQLRQHRAEIEVPPGRGRIVLFDRRIPLPVAARSMGDVEHEVGDLRDSGCLQLGVLVDELAAERAPRLTDQRDVAARSPVELDRAVLRSRIGVARGQRDGFGRAGDRDRRPQIAQIEADRSAADRAAILRQRRIERVVGHVTAGVRGRAHELAVPSERRCRRSAAPTVRRCTARRRGSSAATSHGRGRKSLTSAHALPRIDFAATFEPRADRRRPRHIGLPVGAGGARCVRGVRVGQQEPRGEVRR